MHGATGLTRNVNTNEADLSAAKQPTSLAKINRRVSPRAKKKSIACSGNIGRGTRLVGDRRGGCSTEGEGGERDIAPGVIIPFRRVDG